MIQLQMIDRTKSLAEEDSNVSAVFMYGSFTKDEGDQYSDIEFYVFLHNKNEFDSEEWVNQIHPVSVYFTNEYGSEVSIFKNMVRGEFHFLKIDEMEVIKRWDGLVEFSDFNKMILVDKEGLLTKTLNKIQAKVPDRNTKENIEWLSLSLLNVLLTTSNLIKRGEFAHANQSLSNVQKYLLWLIRIEAKKTNHWESPTKSLEKDLNSDWYSKYKESTASLNSQDIKNAFKHSLKLSEKLFDKLNVESHIKEVLYMIM